MAEQIRRRNTRRKPTPSVRETPTITLIEQIFSEMGYTVTQAKTGITANFKLTSMKEPARWGWVINPETDMMVRRPLELSLEEWRKVAKANVKRLNALRLA